MSEQDKSLVCEKCGFIDAGTYIRRQIERDKPALCSSCSAKPVGHLRTKFGRCRPWAGDFDEEDNPIDAKTGALYRPGSRLCGFKDCVNLAHIVEPLPPPTPPARLTTEMILERIRIDQSGARYDETLMALQEAKEWRRKNYGRDNDARTGD